MLARGLVTDARFTPTKFHHRRAPKFRPILSSWAYIGTPRQLLSAAAARQAAKENVLYAAPPPPRTDCGCALYIGIAWFMPWHRDIRCFRFTQARWLLCALACARDFCSSDAKHRRNAAMLLPAMSCWLYRARSPSLDCSLKIGFPESISFARFTMLAMAALQLGDFGRLNAAPGFSRAIC